MSGKKFCRLCLNEVFITSTNMYSTDFQTREILVNIFPGMNIGLTATIRLCQACFNNVKFVNRVKRGFSTSEQEFLCKTYRGSCSQKHCRLCFRPETPFTNFLTKGYDLAVILKEIDIALAECKFANPNPSICGICWTWVKKMYSFIKHCFKMEESLTLYCNKNKLSVLKDSDLEDFSQEQFCLRTGRLFPEPRQELTQYPINLSITQHQEYFKATGEVYPNLDENGQESREDNACFVANDEENFEEENDVIFISHEKGETNICNYVTDDISYEKPNSYIVDVDDEFTEEIERKNEIEDTIITLDDDDMACQIWDEKLTYDVTNDTSTELVLPTFDWYTDMQTTFCSFDTPQETYSTDDNLDVHKYNKDQNVSSPRWCEEANVGHEDDKSANEHLLLMDDDCFEVIIEERSNIIDLTHVDMERCRSPLLNDEECWGCYVCIAKFACKQTARRHLLNHENPWNKYGRFQCKYCPFKANWKGSVTRHEHSHSQKSQKIFAGLKVKYICPYCDAIYTTRGEIQSHMNEHIISWKRFQCIDCMFTTNMSESLRSHYRNHHCFKKDPSFKRTS